MRRRKLLRPCVGGPLEFEEGNGSASHAAASYSAPLGGPHCHLVSFSAICIENKSWTCWVPKEFVFLQTACNEKSIEEMGCQFVAWPGRRSLACPTGDTGANVHVAWPGRMDSGGLERRRGQRDKDGLGSPPQVEFMQRIC